jgi:hypothetical protein
MNWQTKLPTKPVRNALLRWCNDSGIAYSYALGSFDFDTDGTMQFYDEENNELSVNVGSDTWLKLENTTDVDSVLAK